MLHFIFGFLLIIIAILFIGLSIIGTILRGLFRWGKGPFGSGQDFRKKPETSENKETLCREKHTPTSKKRVFAKDEGEYVDFEEL